MISLKKVLSLGACVFMLLACNCSAASDNGGWCNCSISSQPGHPESLGVLDDQGICQPALCAFR